mgnify:CR=1 FL=1
MRGVQKAAGLETLEATFRLLDAGRGDWDRDRSEAPKAARHGSLRRSDFGRRKADTMTRQRAMKAMPERADALEPFAGTARLAIFLETLLRDADACGRLLPCEAEGAGFDPLRPFEDARGLSRREG